MYTNNNRYKEINVLLGRGKQDEHSSMSGPLGPFPGEEIPQGYPFKAPDPLIIEIIDVIPI